MSLQRVLRLAFVFYCIEVGVFLSLFPWSPAWEYRLLAVASYDWQQILNYSVLRGAVTGFGVVHILWGFHDLKDFLSKSSPPSTPRATDPSSPAGGSEGAISVSPE